MDLIVAPNCPGLCDVARLGDVDARQVADPFAVLRVLAYRHIDPILVEDRRCDHLAGTVEGRVFQWLAVLHPVLRRVTVVAPQLLEHVDAILGDRIFSIETVAPAIASAEDYL